MLYKCEVSTEVRGWREEDKKAISQNIFMPTPNDRAMQIFEFSAEDKRDDKCNLMI